MKTVSRTIAFEASSPNDCIKQLYNYLDKLKEDEEISYVTSPGKKYDQATGKYVEGVYRMTVNIRVNGEDDDSDDM